MDANDGHSPLWIVAARGTLKMTVMQCLFLPFESLKWQSSYMEDLAVLFIENTGETCMQICVERAGEIVCSG